MLLEEILQRLEDEEPWTAVDVEGLIDLVGKHVEHLAGGPDDYDPERYFEEVVSPLARTGALLPLGIPYADGVNAISGPFLPGELFVRALIFAFAGVES